ncbi:MAG: DUF3990 domain-containing protein [Spirochaetales bacterium]|nr:DUF3990 domain-containing protein [Spirochaetales bacterium]
MILYHGSNLEIEAVQLSRCQPYKDFGRGFYTTAMKEDGSFLWIKNNIWRDMLPGIL